MPDTFHLETSTIIQLLGNKDFYRENIAFLQMEEHGLTSVERYNQAVLNKQESVTKKNCKGCSGKVDEKSYVTLAISQFVNTVVKLKEINAKAPLIELKKFIGDRLGYPLDSVKLYYAVGKEKKRTELVF